MTLTTTINPLYFDGSRYFNLSLIWCIDYDTTDHVIYVNGFKVCVYSDTNYHELLKKWCQFWGYKYEYNTQPLNWTDERRDELYNKQMRDKMLKLAYSKSKDDIKNMER